MSVFLDNLYNGLVSRRTFLEKRSATATGLPLPAGREDAPGAVHVMVSPWT